MELPKAEFFDINAVRKFFNSFDHRITKQANSIYEALPEITGMHFTQADQTPSILEKGFQPKGSYPNFVYSFDKKDTDENYGDRLAKAEELGFQHFNVRKTINRFHKAFTQGLNRYGLERLSSIRGLNSVQEYLLENKDVLPVVIFTDMEGSNGVPKGKKPDMLSQMYFNGLPTEKILKTISIETEDFDKISKDVEKGISFPNAIKKILVNKTVDWLQLRVTLHKEEKAKRWNEENDIETRKNPISEWRKPLDDQFGTEFMDKIIDDLRRRVGFDGKGLIQKFDDSEYITSCGITTADIFLDNQKAKLELTKTLNSYSAENRKIADLLTVHSFGGVELIQFGKCKLAKEVEEEAMVKFGRPIETLIYFGSLDDIEVALLTGAKEIYLVDPGLDEEFVKQILERVNQYGKNVVYDETKQVITFDLESRNIVAHIFQETMQKFSERGIKAEGVIMYNKAPGMKTQEAENSLLPNGICVDNRDDRIFRESDEDNIE